MTLCCTFLQTKRWREALPDWNRTRRSVCNESGTVWDQIKNCTDFYFRANTKKCYMKKTHATIQIMPIFFRLRIATSHKHENSWWADWKKFMSTILTKYFSSGIRWSILCRLARQLLNHQKLSLCSKPNAYFFLANLVISISSI